MMTAMTPTTPFTPDPIRVATTQRRMLVAFAVAILCGTVVPIVAGLLSVAPTDGDAAAAPGPVIYAFFGVQLVVTVVYMLAAFGLIRAIGWSPVNQLAFVFICLISMGCGLLLLLSILLINREANRILRERGVKVGLLGVSRSELDRMRQAQAPA